MTTVCHLFDGSVTWEHRAAATQLVERLPPERFRQRLLTVHAGARTSLGELGEQVKAVPSWFGWNILAAPSLARFLSRGDADIIHAWGLEAAGVARMASSLPVVVYHNNPAEAARDGKRLRTLSRPSGFAVVCSSGTTRRRLIEHGIDPSLVVVIRPGVDFGVLNQARKDGLRERLGIASEERVVLVAEPVTRAQGQFDAVWAAVLRNHLSGGLRVVVPGDSPERNRIARFTEGLPTSNPLVLPPPDVPFEQILGIADCLLVTPRGEVSTTAIAWAMAAGCAVIGSAVYSVTELISHKVNGSLFKQTPGRSMTTAILKCLDDRVSLEKTREAARGQAYEVFSVRRFVEQHLQLYENLLAARPPAAGLTDSAVLS